MAETLATAPDGGGRGRGGDLAVDVAGPGRARDARDPAPRSGQPWTDAEYEQILAAAREGTTQIDDVAARLGRTPQAALLKARRLLPIAERSAPVDRVLRLLRVHQEDPGYDWRRVTLEEPPPRPVVQPPALSGLPGLRTDDLVAIGYAVGLAGTSVDADVVARVGEELQRRGLFGELVEYRTERMLRQPGAEIMRARAVSEANSWLERTFLPAQGWPYGYPEGDPDPAYW